jgi:hypothetical protein
MIVTTRADLILTILQTLVIYDLIRLFITITLQLIGQHLRRNEDADK